LLDNVWGEVPQKETTAIMGASGAGKTSLLNVLAGRVRNSAALSVQADIRLNKYRVDPTNMNVRKLACGWEDSLGDVAREAVTFRPSYARSTSKESETLTTRMPRSSGCWAPTKVGGHQKGISGGERKRAAIGVELVVKPNLLFLDEPTSGLDSFSAVRLCQVLKKVANAGATVLFTIHQPSSSLFASFDRLILLHKGRVMYQGPVEAVSSYFGDRGYPSPPHYNPADWIMVRTL
jgi:ABC-type multidrug transport system ATPase subunit